MDSYRKRSQSLEIASNLQRKFFDSNLRTQQSLKLKKRSKIEVNYQRQHALKRVTLNGPLLAQFLQRVEQEETYSLQHQREYEEQALRQASLGPFPHLPRSDEIAQE